MSLTCDLNSTLGNAESLFNFYFFMLTLLLICYEFLSYTTFSFAFNFFIEHPLNRPFYFLCRILLKSYYLIYFLFLPQKSISKFLFFFGNIKHQSPTFFSNFFPEKSIFKFPAIIMLCNVSVI